MNKKSRHSFSGWPASVTIITVFVLSITAWNGMRAWVAIADWNILLRFDGSPAYLLASGLVWFITGCALLGGILVRRRFIWHMLLVDSMIYMIWYWVDRLFIQVSPANNADFSAAASAIIFLAFSAFLFWPSSRVFFTRRHHE